MAVGLPGSSTSLEGPAPPDLTEWTEDDAPFLRPHPNWLRMSSHWRRDDDLVQGTEAMRAAGTDYIPKRGDDDEYEAMLAEAFLYPGLADALERCSTRHSVEPPDLEETPERVQDLAVNVTGSGVSLEDFSVESLELMIRRGLALVWSDNDPEAGQATKGQARRLNLRPWLELLDIARVPNWTLERGADPLDLRFSMLRRLVFVDGEWRLRQYTDLGGVSRESWRQEKEGSLKAADWPAVEEETGDTGLPRLFVRVGYTERKGDMLALPPFRHLSQLNVQQWQREAGVNNLLSAAETPILYWPGVTKEQVESHTLKLGIRRLLYGPSQQALQYVEVNGAGLSLGIQKVASIVDQMKEMGTQPLRSRPREETATGRRIDAKEAFSVAQTWVRSDARLLTSGLRDLAELLGLRDPEIEKCSVKLFDRFNFQDDSTMSVEAAHQARANGDISRETYWDILSRHGVLPEGFNPEEEARRLESEEPFEGDVTE